MNVRGFSLVEVLLAVSIFGLLVTGVVGGLIFGQQSTVLAGQRARATMLADEGFEVLSNMRDENYTNLTSGTYGLSISANQWIFSGTSDISDIFTRSLTLAAIDWRDNRRKSISESITWQQNPQRAGSLSLEGRLTNWRRDFASWATPTVQSSSDLTGATDSNEVALYSTSTATYAVVLRDVGPNAELYVIDVTNPASISVVGSLELGSNANDIAISGDYAVVASDDNAAELQVVNLTTPSSPTLSGSLNLSGNANARSIVATGNNVFLGRMSSTEPEIYSISVSTPTSPALLTSLELGADVLKMSLAQNDQYVYAATPNNSNELRIISVSSPSSLSITGSYDATGASDGTAVTAFSTYAVLGRGDGTILVIQASTPASPTLVSSALDIGTQINDLAIGVGDIYVFAATNTGSTPTMIIDIATVATPVLLGSVTMSGNTRGIVWDFDLNRAFTAGTDNSTELSVIRPN